MKGGGWGQARTHKASQDHKHGHKNNGTRDGHKNYGTQEKVDPIFDQEDEEEETSKQQYFMPEGEMSSDEEMTVRRVHKGNTWQKCSTFWTKPANLICLLATTFLISMTFLIQGYLCPNATDFYLNLYCPYRQNCESCSGGGSCDCGFSPCQLREDAPKGCRESRCEMSSNLLKCSSETITNADGTTTSCCDWVANQNDSCNRAAYGSVYFNVLWRVMSVMGLMGLAFVVCWCCCD